MLLDVLLLFWKEFFFLMRNFTGMIKYYQKNVDIYGYFSHRKKWMVL